MQSYSHSSKAVRVLSGKTTITATGTGSTETFTVDLGLGYIPYTKIYVKVQGSNCLIPEPLSQKGDTTEIPLWPAASGYMSFYTVFYNNLLGIDLVSFDLGASKTIEIYYLIYEKLENEI